MTPERWQRIEDIFMSALDLAGEERTAFLQTECGGDTELRLEVDSLLEAEGEAHQQLESVVKAVAKQLPGPGPKDQDMGLHIGPYVLVRELGQGGMGSVYLGVRTDNQYLQAVAVKLVRPGMGSDFLISRFRAERQILANLNHPHIARLLDGGTTTDDRPYFVMEYIEGEPLLDYCALHHLQLRPRLELFLAICAAVQHAHQKLVVHRDIKPANILVTREGVPKLLDFGIAKLLMPELGMDATPKTALSMRLMTPDYASPEQVRGEEITTAADIYSLGALLYELLTGQRPYRMAGKSLPEIEEAVCRREPPRPSMVTELPERLRRQLTGDLDNIILMAMRKEPLRRYRTAEQMAADVRSYLEGLPISARKDTWRYRTGKLIVRHKLSVVAAGLVTASLIAGLAMTTYQARRAERRFAQVRRLANAFLFDLDEKAQQLPGSTELRSMMVQTALGYLDSLSQESGSDPTLQWELATAYTKVGDVQGAPNAPNLGQTDAALRSYRKALELYEQIEASQRREPRLMRSLADAHYRVGDMQATTGDPAGALRSFRRGLELAQNVVPEEERTSEEFRLLVAGYDRIGDGEWKSGNAQAALMTYRQGLMTLERWDSLMPSEQTQSGIAQSHAHIGHALLDLRQLAAARDSYSRALSIRQSFLQRHPLHLRNRRELALLYQALGNVSGSPAYPNLGLTLEALRYYQQSLELIEQLVREDSRNAQARADLSVAYVKVGNMVRDTEPARAEEMYNKALEILNALREGANGNIEFRRSEAFTYTRLAYPQKRLGKYQAAMENLRRAEALQEHILSADPTNTPTREELEVTYTQLGDLSLEQKDFPTAESSYRNAVATAEHLLTYQPNSVALHIDLAECYERYGALRSKQAAEPALTSAQRVVAWSEAVGWYQRALDLWNTWGRQGESAASDHKRRQEVAQKLAESQAALTRLGRS